MREPSGEDLSIEGLFRPRADRAYFAGPGGRPFAGSPGTFSALDAWWLAEASALAYVPDPEVVRRALAGAGFGEVTFHSARSTHAFVADDGRTRVVVFRGTEHLDLEDFRTDLSMILARDPRAGSVHRGFAEATDLVWSGISARLAEGGDRPVRFAGHSLGAALATLAAARHGSGALITFGSPRVGDADFRDAFPVPAFRVVNLADIVCRVPPPPYRHVGLRCYLGADGRPRLDPGRRERFREEVRGRAEHAREVMLRWLSGDFRALPFPAFADHSPFRYADRLRAGLSMP
jgi:hypothetical protein